MTEAKTLVTAGILDVVDERLRQIKEGWTSVSDDAHVDGELATAAVSYVVSSIAWAFEGQESSEIVSKPPKTWPWLKHWWKPTSQRRDLVKAAALIIAEIDRLDRLEKRRKS